ncbi:MAG: nucleoside-triphosphatase [Bacteroidetes bacterium]|nr:nucleoside-triphosphatase [Bacteroidota bacterium]MBU1680980.1 nucleoside-triphosphatase [Bacteroidota bacterium]
MAEVIIISDKIKTGKTTRLMRWCSEQKNIDGILQPVIEGKRFFYRISSRTLKQLEVDEGKNVTEIGKYKFSNDAFDWARKILIESFETNIDYLTIDEVGPLELKGKGLEPAVSKIISNRNVFQGKMIFVVRENILAQFLEHYKLADEYKIFSA